MDTYSTKDTVPIFSILIPTYRGEQNIPELLERLCKVMSNLGEPWEVLFVNDDSPDGTWEVLLELKEMYPQIRAIRLMSNVGQFKALMCGFDHVRGQYIITMDDDLQNPPEEIPKLFDCLKKHPTMDGIIASYPVKHHSPLRRIGKKVVHYINCMAGRKDVNLETNSFRLLRRKLVEAVRLHHTRNPVIGPLLFNNSRHLMNVLVEHHDRKHGDSNYTMYRLIKLTLDHLLNYSVLPLKIISVIGLASSSLAILMSAFYVVSYLISNVGLVVQGWTTIVLLITFFSGLILFSLGFIGEYLIRIIREVSHSPRYFIREEF
jgi:dolichol-phosphate mannosyltransferase/undecaprenyl-phosphate 4-deoxy-4-formamido-L-arabinose transferase